MKTDSKKIAILKRYFKKEPEVLLAFLFGSQAKGISRKISDWDIGVYFKPKEYLELETEIDYPRENKIWSDLIDILGTDDVDLVVLNRARPDLVYTILAKGLPLKIANRKLYLELLSKTSYEAIDWWQFVNEFWKIGEKTRSLLPEERKSLQEHLRFLENEFEQIEEIKKFSWNDFSQDPFKRKIVERWVENLVMSALDIAKIILASQKKNIPESYKDILKVFTCCELNFNEKGAGKFSEFAKLRNIVVHEYLDLEWKKIRNFIKEAEKFYPKFIKKVKNIIK